METEIRYYLNGKHIDGWDEPEGEWPVNIEAAAQNLTDYEPGDVFRAEQLDGYEHVLDSIESTLD